MKIPHRLTQYPTPVDLINLVLPPIGITLGQGGAYVPINLTETAAFYGQSDGLDQVCANIELVNDDKIMLGTPFFLDRYIQLDLDKRVGHVSQVTNCSQFSAKISSHTAAPDNASFKMTTTLSLSVLFVSLYLF